MQILNIQNHRDIYWIFELRIPNGVRMGKAFVKIKHERPDFRAIYNFYELREGKHMVKINFIYFK